MTRNESIGYCERFRADELVYHSSEQYLIMCLKLCSLILANGCSVRDLIADLNESNLNASAAADQDLKRLKKFQAFDDDLDLLRHLEQQQSLPPTIAQHSNNNYQLSPNQQQQQSNLIEIASDQLGKLNYGTLLFSNLNETECIKYGHRESYKLTLFICGIVLCLLIIMLNSLTLFTIVRSRRLYNSITNILVANLSISDFLSGLAFLYPCALNLLTINALETYNSRLYTLACNIRQNYYLCLMGYSPIITSMLSSMLTLTLLALEKYMAIIYPYAYERLINDRKYLCYLILFFVWLISIVVSLLPIMGWNEHNKYSTYRGFDCMHPNSLPCMFERIFTLDYILLFTSICGLCALTMLAIYAQIYLTARKHSQQIAKQQKNLNLVHSSSKCNEEVNNGSIVELSERWSQQTQEHSSNHTDLSGRASTITIPHVLTAAKRSMKAMKTLLILLMGFYTCWLPLIVYFLTFASKKYNNLTIYILMFIACCNALIDPLVYAFRNREFCKELLSNFRR